jgi:hypothetical protein
MVTPDGFYRKGCTIYPIRPDMPTVVCGECGDRFKARADGTPPMHSRAAREGEQIAAAYWCAGGVPAAVRGMAL